MIDAGIYIAFFRLTRTHLIVVGGLGSIRFKHGIYLYVGSAQKGLTQRLERHARHRKSKHWHIDYLSSRTTFLGAIVLEGPKTLECKVAAMLARRYGVAVADFGSSDCGCGGHLFHLDHFDGFCT